jgi:hypothetical protein
MGFNGLFCTYEAIYPLQIFNHDNCYPDLCCGIYQ